MYSACVQGSTSPSLFQSKTNVGSFLTHMFWVCPKLLNYWTVGYFWAGDATGSLIAIFGITGEDSPLRGADCKIAVFKILLARRLIMLNWKNHNPTFISYG